MLNRNDRPVRAAAAALLMVYAIVATAIGVPLDDLWAQRTKLDAQISELQVQRAKVDAQIVAAQATQGLPEGFTRVAGENETVDFGTTPTDVAYGAAGKFKLRAAVTGKLTFNNGSFGGDPISGTRKAGYAKPSLVPATLPATQALKLAGVHLTISDAAIPDDAIRELGFDGLRIWAEYANGRIPTAAVERANGLIARGLQATLVVTPEGAADATATVDYLIAKCDRAVRINLVNEANWGGYWPGNDWRAAYKAMAIHAARLKAAGFSVGPPSFTGWVDQWEGYYAELAAAGLLEPYASIVIHPYGKDRAEVLKALTIGRRIADRYGKQLDADEYGLKSTTPLATALTELPGVIKDVRALCDRSGYFIASETGKQPHDNFAWARLKNGQWRENVRAMLRTANGLVIR